MTAGTSASPYVQTTFPSLSNPCGTRARAPVARMMCGASIVRSSPSIATTTRPLPARVALPPITGIFAPRSRDSTVFSMRAAVFFARSTIAETSNETLSALTPYDAPSRARANTSAERSSALVGMHPWFAQTPPRRSRSMTTADSPRAAARSAAT
jgi:hypothetical protein